MDSFLFKIGLLLLLLINCGASLAQQTKKIEFDADVIEFDEQINKFAKRLCGNVVFRHEDIIMNCDSAYFYSDQNSLDAYSNVEIHQGDSVNLFGDYLQYNGNIKVAKIRKNVRLEHGTAYLLTDSLNYDRNEGVGYYFNYGEIIDSVNKLTSKTGFYYSDTKDFISIDSVILVNPDYVMYSDTLKYNTESEISYFYGPTDIISDSNYIYCENGWYSTISDIAQFNKNAYLKNNKQILMGDSLYYARHYKGGNGFGEAFNNVVLVDSTEKITLTGNYAYYYENPERSLLTDSAVFLQTVDGDSMFLHADTLMSIFDTSGQYKFVKAYHKAKLFKRDMQGMSDSVLYSLKDSVIHLYRTPVVWSEENQIVADYIEIHMKNSVVDFVIMENSAFVTSQEDTLRYNQIKGKRMIGYFRGEELYKIEVIGNGETIYYAKDNDELIGVNKAVCSKMNIFLENSEVKEIIMLTKPEGTLNPVNHLTKEESRLKEFSWLDTHRPKKKQDIFIWLDKN